MNERERFEQLMDAVDNAQEAMRQFVRLHIPAWYGDAQPTSETLTSEALEEFRHLRRQRDDATAELDDYLQRLGLQ
jgi:hypothetical protein